MVDAFKTKSMEMTGGFNTSKTILGGRKMDYKDYDYYWHGLYYPLANDGWKSKVIRVSDYKVYFFDKKGVYTFVSVDEAQSMDLIGLEKCYPFEQYYCFERQRMSEEMKRAILALEVGDDIKEFEKDIERLRKSKEENPIGILNTVYLVKDEKYYFFNDEGIYSCLDRKSMLKSGIRAQRYKKKYLAVNIDKLIKLLGKEYDRYFLKEALLKMKIGDKLEKLENCYNEVLKEDERFSNSVERFVTLIEKPDFVCVPENPKKSTTFDYIHVDINLVTEWETDKKEFINKNIEKITAMVLESIANNGKFKRYGVPINILKIAGITLRNDLNSMHYVFEIKKTE